MILFFKYKTFVRFWLAEYNNWFVLVSKRWLIFEEVCFYFTIGVNVKISDTRNGQAGIT